MEDEYYIPEIEEFHVGFEFEVGEEDNYNKTTFKISDISNWSLINGILNIQKTVGQVVIRVKYLDREDIESLGWGYTGGQMIRGGKCYFLNRKENIGITFRPNFYRDGHGCVHVYRVKPQGGIEQSIFEGKIGNKNELEKIMQQVGIG